VEGVVVRDERDGSEVGLVGGKGGRKSRFGGESGDLSEGELLLGSLVVCEDMGLGRKSRFDCGIRGLDLGGELNNVDKVIVGWDRLEDETAH
jgi:hypothetical protein